MKGIEETVKDFCDRTQCVFVIGSSVSSTSENSSFSVNSSIAPRPDPAAPSKLMIDQATSTIDEDKVYTVYAERYLNFEYLALKFEQKNISAFCLGTFKNIITVNNCTKTWKKELKKLLLQQQIETLFICKPKKHLYLRIKDVNVNFFSLKKKNICTKCNNINCLSGKITQYFNIFHSINFENCDSM